MLGSILIYCTINVTTLLAAVCDWYVALLTAEYTPAGSLGPNLYDHVALPVEPVVAVPAILVPFDFVMVKVTWAPETATPPA